MKKKPKCRYCQRDVFWTVVGTKIHDDGTIGHNRRAFEFETVPTETCRVAAVVFSRSRGLLDVHNVANPPALCHPVHRCPQYEQALVLDELEQLRLGTLLDTFMDDALAGLPISAGASSDAGDRNLPRRRDANAG